MHFSPMPPETILHGPVQLGMLVRRLRKASGVTQAELAGSSGIGLRFIVELEKGKPTCELGKALHVLQMLGARVVVRAPVL